MAELRITSALTAFFVVARLVRRRASGGVALLAVCLTIIGLNTGEATFFLPRSLGLLLMILMQTGAIL